jgi:hypothetical protein
MKLQQIFIKYFLEKKISLSHHITKEKKTFISSKHPIPHHQKNNSLKNQKNLTFHLEKQPNFSLPCHPKNNPLGKSPSPKNFTYPNPLKRNLLLFLPNQKNYENK